LAGAVAVGIAGPAAGQAPVDPHAVQPERPTVATHAGLVATGWIEIETGLERDRSGGTTSFLAPTVIKIGLARRAQLNVGLPLARPDAGSLGGGDLSVGIKWRLGDDLPVVRDFAILPSLKLPTGSTAAGRGTGTTDFSLLAISSRTLGPVSLDLNAGVTWRTGDGTAAPTLAAVWTVSAGTSVSGALGWVAECYGYPGTSGPAGSAGIVALLTGPTYTLRPWLAFDLGLIVPLTGPQPNALYAGTVVNAGRLWSRRRPAS
jgi:hypothetical protein